VRGAQVACGRSAVQAWINDRIHTQRTMSAPLPKAGLQTWLSNLITFLIGPNRWCRKYDDEGADD